MARPTKYDPAMCERVIEFGRDGYSRAEMAAGLDITRATMATYEAEHPEFLNAVAMAHDLSLAWWEAKPRTNLTTPGFQSSLWSKSMSGRFPSEPYRERHEVAGPNGGAIPIERVERVIVDPKD